MLETTGWETVDTLDVDRFRVVVAFVIAGAFVVLNVVDGVIGKLEITVWETVDR